MIRRFLGKVTFYRHYIRYACVALMFALPETMFAEKNTIGSVFRRLTKPLTAFDDLLIEVAYLAGVGFGITGIFKLKQHKDNPQQVPITNGIALMMTGVLLVFMPGLINPTAKSIFGTDDVSWTSPDHCTSGPC